MDLKSLGETITLKEIKECVRQKQSIEFSVKPKQVNLDNTEIKDYIKKMGSILLPPLINKSEIFKTLYLIDPITDSQKWDYIVLLTYINEGEIFYSKIDENYYLATIKF